MTSGGVRMLAAATHERGMIIRVIPLSTIAWIVALAAPSLGGCHTWHRRATPESSPAERTVRVTTSNGRRLTLERAVVRPDSVVGRLSKEAVWDRDRWSVEVTRSGERTAVAVADVQAVEERKLDALESAGTFVAVTVAVALLVFLSIVYGLRGDS